MIDRYTLTDRELNTQTEGDRKIDRGTDRDTDREGQLERERE